MANQISLKSIAELISQTSPPDGMETRIVAIDGCGGAGKSTLATRLAKFLGDCAVVHTDDFASMDNSQNWYPRMLEQFLEPVRGNEIAKFQKYDWNRRQPGDWITIAPPQRFIILEGVTSSRTEFRPFLSYKIFVQTDRGVRLERGLKRDGQQALDLWQEWMREEDEYIARDNPEAVADLIVSGESPTTNADEVIVLR